MYKLLNAAECKGVHPKKMFDIKMDSKIYILILSINPIPRNPPL